MARAEAIKDKLGKLGAPEDRITNSSQRLNNFQSGELIYNPVDFEFMEATAKVEEVAEAPVATRSVLDPFTIRFETGESKLEKSSELRGYLDRALAYLGENPGTVLMVTGHTDDEGSSTSNLSLSKSRASKVRRFLRNNGVASAQVKYQGKGETEPLATNDADEGKRQNRRVEIQISN